MVAGLSVAIIGGNGIIGSWLARLFESRGARVVISDPRPGTISARAELSQGGNNVAEMAHATESCGSDQNRNAEVAASAQVVILAVPLSVTAAVTSSIAPLLRTEQLFVEVASVKSPLLPLLTQMPCEVLSLHPLFSPVMGDLNGEVITFTKIRGGALTEEFLPVLGAMGFHLEEVQLHEHDAIMARVQALVHLESLVFGEVLRRCGDALVRDIACSTPNFRVRLSLLLRLLSQDHGLYASILTSNPRVSEVCRSLQEVLNEMTSSIERGDVGAVTAVIERLADWVQHSKEGSSSTLERLESASGDLLTAVSGMAVNRG